MPGLSVYQEAQKEVAVYKWLESEKAGKDMGVDAVTGWNKAHWLHFYRYRFVQHLRGEVYWQEFDEESFAVVGRRFSAPQQVIDEILDRVKAGAENLDLIELAVENHWSMDLVVGILEALDINSQRLTAPE